MSVTAVGLFARAPSAEGKSRLAPGIPADRLPALREALVRDAIAVVAATPGVRRFLFYEPAGADGEVARMCGRDWTLIAQQTGDLGRRMHLALESMLERGHHAAILVGSDVPLLAPVIIRDAARALDEGANVAIGPAADGGYYLIGARGVHATLFEGIEWGTAGVLVETLRRAEEAHLEVTTVGETFDVDTLDDLRRAERALVSAPPGVSSHLRAWFSRFQIPNS